MEIEPEIEPEWFIDSGPEPEPVIIRRGSRIRFRNRPLTNTNTNTKEGLHPCDLKLLPTFTYSSSDTHTLDDCAVCLSEFADGDEGRLLPKCNHTFHSRCIDEWFRSHSNCPLCRTPVQQPEPEEFVEPASSSVEPVPVEMEDERLRDADDLTP